MLDPDIGWLLSLILFPLALVILLILIVRSILKLSHRSTLNKRSRIDKFAIVVFLLGGLSLFYYLFIVDSSNKYRAFLLSATLFTVGVISTFVAHPPFTNKTIKK